jgi:hypothetical protein
VLPVALATGLRTADFNWLPLPLWLAAGALTGLVLVVIFKQNSLYAAAALAAVCFLAFQLKVFPDIDRIVSARPLWISQHPSCVPDLHRRLVFGLNYYAGRELPRCDGTAAGTRYP